MSPLPGGHADKVGNRYEGAWAIRYAMLCLLDDRRFITVEEIDTELNLGSEFTYESEDGIEAHQLKRQNGNSNSWPVKALAKLDVFSSAASHVAAKRSFNFVSLVPSRKLQELSERTRMASDLKQFIDSPELLTEDLRPSFTQLSNEDMLGSAQAAFSTLQGMTFRVHDENDIVLQNRTDAERTLTGATGHLTALAIGDILANNFGRRLGRAQLLEELAKHRIEPLAAGHQQSVLQQVDSVTTSWRTSVERDLLQPSIERAETQQVLQALNESKLVLVSGTAGGGKSAVLEQTLRALEQADDQALAFRLDRLESFASTDDMGTQLGLEGSPAVALALAAANGNGYLIVDQLDAVGLASGRMSRSFDVVADLLREAQTIPGVRVILACREFDVENDYRISALASQPHVARVTVGHLETESVKTAVAEMGLDPERLTSSQLALLQTPLHLVLLQSIASHPDALAFESRNSLFAAFWERKRQEVRERSPEVRFSTVLGRVANEISDRQTLSIPAELLDEDELAHDADILVSWHVLARDGDRISFFHEAFFDYVFARQWVSRKESLVRFLLRDEQELFRRGQVRQILQHLRDRDPGRFMNEIEELLTSTDIRFHIKEATTAVVANIADPTREEADLFARLAQDRPDFDGRLWQQLRRGQWFSRFDEGGFIGAWLDSGDTDLVNRAINLMIAGSRDYGDRVAELLWQRSDSPPYTVWLQWIAHFADVHENRRLFDMLLQAVRDGAYDDGRDLWFTVHDLAKHEPLWAIELLQARFIDHHAVLALNDDGKVADLLMREYSAAELIRQASVAEPLAFLQVVVPFLRAVMAKTLHEPRDGTPTYDKHFSLRMGGHDLDDDRAIDDALLAATVKSFERLAKEDPSAINTLLEVLAEDPYETSQFILYRALIAGGEAYAQWAGELVLESEERLRCGYVSDLRWVARELVRAIAPHLTTSQHERMESAFLGLRNTYESTRNYGRTVFSFLSALDETRLTEPGRRRLAELRRKFHVEAPSPPQGVTGGFVTSPISEDASSKMTDEQWLRAIAKYHTEEHDWDSLRGGARELSHVLRQRAAADPERFSKLALAFDGNVNPAYTSAILMGLGDSKFKGDPSAMFEAIRHIGALGNEEDDQWLGMSLRPFNRIAPLDLFTLVLDRALHSADPADNRPVFVREGQERRAEDLRANGINTARGTLAEELGGLLIRDETGERTALVKPHLMNLASDPVLSVRSCVAHVLAASLRHARAEVIPAFHRLIDTDDVLLASGLVQSLMLYIGSVNPEVIEPVIDRMLSSDDPEARESGGQIAAFAALEWGMSDAMQAALQAGPRARVGAASLCAARFDRAADMDLAAATLKALMNDDDEDVRKAVAELAPNLREQPLRSFTDLLAALIDSDAYEHATPQLLLTLQHAPDSVEELVLKASHRFLDVFGREAADIRTGAAGDAHYISELVVRGLAQSHDQAHRSALLDVLDRLLIYGVYGIDDAIAQAERI